LQLNNIQITDFLLALEGVGAVFLAIFLAAYLGGLPSNTVLVSEPAFKIPLTVFGVVLLVLILAAVVLAVASKKKE
jgi:hypothetical protein